VHGYAVAMWWVVGILVLAAVIVMVAVTTGIPMSDEEQDDATGVAGRSSSNLDGSLS
jgi:hypothetical protein